MASFFVLIIYLLPCSFVYLFSFFLFVLSQLTLIFFTIFFTMCGRRVASIVVVVVVGILCVRDAHFCCSLVTILLSNDCCADAGGCYRSTIRQRGVRNVDSCQVL